MIAERCPPRIDDLEEKIEELEDKLQIAIETLTEIKTKGDITAHILAIKALTEIRGNDGDPTPNDHKTGAGC